MTKRASGGLTETTKGTDVDLSVRGSVRAFEAFFRSSVRGVRGFLSSLRTQKKRRVKREKQYVRER